MADIFANEEPIPVAELGFEEILDDRSKEYPVGELTPCAEIAGEYAPLRGFEPNPPPPPPAPGPGNWKLPADCCEGVIVLERGDVIDRPA